MIYNGSLLFTYFIYSSDYVNLSPPHLAIPLGDHKLIFYVYESIYVL